MILVLTACGDKPVRILRGEVTELMFGIYILSFRRDHDITFLRRTTIILYKT